MDEKLKAILTNEQTTNIVLLELSNLAVEIGKLQDKLSALEKKRKQTIIRVRSHNVPITTIANIANINRGSVKKILEQHYFHKNLFTSDVGTSESLRQEVIPDDIQAELDAYSAALKAEQDKLSDS